MDYRTELYTLAQDVEQIAPHIDLGDIATSIDAAARIRKTIKALQDVEKDLTKTLTGDVVLDMETDQGASGILPGIDFYATVIETVRWSIDSKAVRAEMGDDWYDQRCKRAVVRSVRYKENG